VNRSPEETDLLRIAWGTGNLRYLLYPLQEQWKEAYDANGRRVFVIDCSRRIGKTVFILESIFEVALRTPKGQARYAAPTKIMVENIINPTIDEIFLPDCPSDMRPVWKAQKGIWLFPNGFTLHIAGVNDGHADDLRGPWANIVAIDEAGFVNDLGYVMKDVLMPQLLTTRGRMLVASSPAKTPAHQFTDVCLEAEAASAYIHATIYDALEGGHPALTPEVIEEFAEEVGGKDTTTWQREYLARRVVDAESAIIPEFTDLEAQLVEDFDRVDEDGKTKFPEHYACYVVGDNGFVDIAFWLFIVHDFKRDLLLVQDEHVFQHATSADMRPVLLAKEHELWKTKVPEFRLADATAQTLAEFVRHDLEEPYPVGKAPNDDLDATVNGLRVATKRLKYRVHPRCRRLRLHLRNGIWNDAHTKFKRVPGYGHFDGIAALMYAERCIPRDINPYPTLPEGANPVDWHLPPEQTRYGLRSLGSRWRK
jgi:hypothetical protein